MWQPDRGANLVVASCPDAGCPVRQRFWARRLEESSLLRHGRWPCGIFTLRKTSGAARTARSNPLSVLCVVREGLFHGIPDTRYTRGVLPHQPEVSPRFSYAPAGRPVIFSWWHHPDCFDCSAFSGRWISGKTACWGCRTKAAAALDRRSPEAVCSWGNCHLKSIQYRAKQSQQAV